MAKARKSRAASRRLCKCAHCSRSDRIEGYCTWHWVMKQLGLPLGELGDACEDECAFPGCQRDEFALGLCRPHYHQHHRGRQLTDIGPGESCAKRCKFPGCGWRARSKGYCRGHYMQWYRGVTLRPLHQKPPKLFCTTPGHENREARARGLCDSCYQRDWKARREAGGRALRRKSHSLHGGG